MQNLSLALKEHWLLTASHLCCGLFASFNHDRNCLALILPHTVSDVVMLIPLCCQVTNYVDVVSEHVEPEETINDTISEKCNISQNGLKLVSI